MRVRRSGTSGPALRCHLPGIEGWHHAAAAYDAFCQQCGLLLGQDLVCGGRRGQIVSPLAEQVRLGGGAAAAERVCWSLADLTAVTQAGHALAALVSGAHRAAPAVVCGCH